MALKSKERNLSFDVLRWMDDQNDDVLSSDRPITDQSVIQNGTLKKKKKRNKKKSNKVKSIEIQPSIMLKSDDVVSLGGRGRDLCSYKSITSSTVTVVEERTQNDDSKCNGVNEVLKFEGKSRERNVGSGNGKEVGSFKKENGNFRERYKGSEDKVRQRRISGGGEEGWGSGIGVEEPFKNENVVLEFGGNSRERDVGFKNENGVVEFGGKLRQRRISGGGEEGWSSVIVGEENEKKEICKNGDGVLQVGGELRPRRISGGGDEGWGSGIVLEDNGKKEISKNDNGVLLFGGTLRQRRISGGSDESWCSGIVVDENGKKENCKNDNGVLQVGGKLRQRRISGEGDESWCSGSVVEQNGKEESFKNDTVSVVDESNNGVNGVSIFGGKLRQRRISGGGEESWTSGMVMEEYGKEELGNNDKEERGVMESDRSSKMSEILNGRTLETEASLDWKQFMATDPRLMENSSVEISPIKHFMEVLHTGHSIRSTVTLGNEKDRERVYDTIFRLPWRCELLIDVGFFVCLDSFLSVFTIVPVRMAMTLWKSLKTRQFHKPSAEELSDFGCLLVLASGVTLLQQIDISLIYHMIRGQGTIKLYVVYNVLEIFDKLFQSFVGDVMQTVFNSANGLANCAPENTWNALPRFISDEILAIVSAIIHSFILLVQAITLSTCIVAHNNALFALLVSNNFAEIKSNVFKRFSRDNVHSIVYSDSVERFHICAFLLFVLAQNLLEAEGPWFSNFLSNALLVYICEVLIDIIKHSFIAKFNDIKPIAFSEFLEDLSKQTLNKLTEPGKRKLIFVPLSPACVVLRVLRPVFAAHLPSNPLPWRLLCMFLLSAMTFVMLGVLKIMVSMGLKKHASWYVKRCEKRKSHTD